jgi:hypothetical protein
MSPGDTIEDTVAQTVVTIQNGIDEMFRLFGNPATMEIALFERNELNSARNALDDLIHDMDIMINLIEGTEAAE